MIRRVIIIVFMALLLLIMSSCTPWNFEYCPASQYDTRWTCKELDIYFDVSNKFKDVTSCSTYGQINLNGKITEFAVLFDFVGTVDFMPIYTEVLENGSTQSSVNHWDTWLFLGKCKFSKNKCVITVFNNEKGFFDNSVKTLTFIKGGIPEDAFVPDAADIPEVVLIPEDIPQPESPPVHTDMI